jgi:hypothetical protein
VRVAVHVDDTGAEVEDDEPFDAERAAQMIRIVGAELLNVYEAALRLESAQEAEQP